MERITQKDLEYRVARINEVTNSPIESWTRRGKEGAKKPGFKANIDNYHLDYAYGGVRLVQHTNEGGGIRVISSTGFGTKRELYNWMNAFLDGIAIN